MRKTQLWNKREATPEYYDPRVTNHGRMNEIRIEKKISTQSQAKRFIQYDNEAKRLGSDLGPGSYLQFHGCMYASRPKGTPLYKRFFRQRDLNDNWYYFINQSYNKPSTFRKTF